MNIHSSLWLYGTSWFIGAFLTALFYQKFAPTPRLESRVYQYDLYLRNFGQVLFATVWPIAIPTILFVFLLYGILKITLFIFVTLPNYIFPSSRLK